VIAYRSLLYFQRVMSDPKTVAAVVFVGVLGRGIRSSTFQLNVSAFHGTGGVYGGCRKYLWRGLRGCLGV